MKLTNSISTGHFAMFQTCTAVSPTPSTLPDLLGEAAGERRPPTALMAVSTMSSTVRPTRTGSVFQIGRPSSMS